MRKTYVVSAKRSAIGSFLGSLTTVKPVDLGATVVKALLEDGKDSRPALRHPCRLSS